ncbi:MAG: XdhC/CoxI family protein [Candidatus Latescibacteria bacterium]|nr:XdhC/CoxI family protein [Candidatus Latescibacterota bacterium]
MQDIFKEALEIVSRGERAALSTIVSSKGSLPMSKKAKMLIRPDNKTVGTVGGGCLEADVWAEGRRVMETGVPNLQHFILTEKHAGEDGLNCGGNVEIFTEPITAEGSRPILEEIIRLRRQDRSAVLATLVSGEDSSAAKLLVHRDGTTFGTLGAPGLDLRVREEIGDEIDENLLKILNVEVETPAGPKEVRIFLESIVPAPALYLFGGGHVSLQIARIAKAVGFRIIVVDDRPMFANPERFPEADETHVLDMDTCFDALEIDEQSYLVAVTRGHQHDKPVIRQAVRTNAKYIGMIGSRRKIALMWKQLEEEGIPRARLEEVHAPIGLNIGADNPEEIAVSVVAQLIAIRRSGGKPVHTEAMARETVSPLP